MWLTWRKAQTLTHFQTAAAAVLGISTSSTLIYLLFLIRSFLSPTCVHFLGGFLWQLLEHLLQDDGETNSAGRERERMRGSDKSMSFINAMETREKLKRPRTCNKPNTCPLFDAGNCV